MKKYEQEKTSNQRGRHLKEDVFLLVEESKNHRYYSEIQDLEKVMVTIFTGSNIVSYHAAFKIEVDRDQRDYYHDYSCQTNHDHKYKMFSLIAINLVKEVMNCIIFIIHLTVVQRHKQLYQRHIKHAT